MIERFGVRGSQAEGVFFTEAEHVAGTDLGNVKITCQGQNKNLNDVKRELARRVQQKGGDVLVAFRYEQKTGFWGDSWHGSGRVVRAGLG